MSTYTKAAGSAGSAVGIVVVVVSRHDYFVLKIKVEGYIGAVVVRWRIKRSWYGKTREEQII